VYSRRRTLNVARSAKKFLVHGDRITEVPPSDSCNVDLTTTVTSSNSRFVVASHNIYGEAVLRPRLLRAGQQPLSYATASDRPDSDST